MSNPFIPLSVLYFSHLATLVNTSDPGVTRVFDALGLPESNPRDTVKTIYDYVKNLRYLPDDTKFSRFADYWQTPGETIQKGRGDCDDLTVLAASLYTRAEIANFLVLTTGQSHWRQFHVANLVRYTTAPTGMPWTSFVYLDASYPHPMFSLPGYAGDALVIGVFTPRFPFNNPFLSLTPVPLVDFVEKNHYLSLVTVFPQTPKELATLSFIN